MSSAGPEASATRILAAWAVLAAITLAFAIPAIHTTGLYYDEAFMAQQARDFAQPERAGVHPPSVSTIHLAGRPFPLRNAAYLGSLKSQLLIPSLMIFGSSVDVLRITTLATGLLGVLFAMLWTGRLFGTGVALVTGLLIVADPGFHFFSQYEWGPFTTLFLCRMLGFCLICTGLTAGSAPGRWIAMIAGGAVLGLGVYARADFAIILISAVLALALTLRRTTRSAIEQNLAPIAAGTLASIITASPMIQSVQAVLDAGARMADRGDLAYRAQVMWSVLDGSHFHRLMETGGLFERIFEEERTAPATGFAPVLLIALVIVVSLSQTRRKSGAGMSLFIVAMAASIAAFMIALPGAVRAHHMLNILPLPQIIVAAAGVGLWRREWSRSGLRAGVRACVAISFAALLIADVALIHQTREFMFETGGRGRFARALDTLAEDLDSRPDAAEIRVISLDWGFHENLLFSTDHLQLAEPIWKIPLVLASGRSMTIQGDGNTFYLVHEAPFDLFGLGAPLLRAVEGLGGEDVEIRVHENREGEKIFTSVRLKRTHRLLYDGAFRVILE